MKSKSQEQSCASCSMAAPGQVRVRVQIAGCAERLEQIAQDGQMARSGVDNGGRWLIEPNGDEIENQFLWYWLGAEVGPGGQPQDGEDSVPRLLS